MFSHQKRFLSYQPLLDCLLPKTIAHSCWIITFVPHYCSRKGDRQVYSAIGLRTLDFVHSSFLLIPTSAHLYFSVYFAKMVLLLTTMSAAGLQWDPRPQNP